MKTTWQAPTALAALSAACWVGWGASFSATMDWADGPAGVPQPWHYAWTWPLAAAGLVLAVGTLVAFAMGNRKPATHAILAACVAILATTAATLTTFTA